MWPVLLTGSHSVIPWIIPRKTAFKNSKNNDNTPSPLPWHGEHRAAMFPETVYEFISSIITETHLISSA